MEYKNFLTTMMSELLQETHPQTFPIWFIFVPKQDDGEGKNRVLLLFYTFVVVFIIFIWEGGTL